MTIDKKRLATDAAYWDEVAPEGATHYDDRYLAPWRRSEKGCEFYFSAALHNWVSTSRTDSAGIPRPTKPAAPEWDGEGYPPVGCKCIAQDFEFCKEVLVLAYADSHGEEKSVMLTEILEDGRHGRLHAFIARRINFSPLSTKEQRERDELNQIIDAAMRSGDGDAAAAILAAGWHKRDS